MTTPFVLPPGAGMHAPSRPDGKEPFAHDGRLPSSQAFDHLVYLRVFEGCNLHCRHCFIPANPKRMSLADIEAVPATLARRIPEGSRLLLQWHGGEPTLMGATFIAEGIRRLRSAGPGFTWRFGIQTNLMTFSPAWADLYHAEFGSEVGVSWDPDIRLLNRHAADSSKLFEERFEARLADLVAAGLTPYLVVTATRTLFARFPNPFDFFQHWIERGVRHVHLERVTATGYARENWDEIGLSNGDYARNMSRWMRAYTAFRRTHGDRLLLSPFDGLAESVRALASGEGKRSGCWSGACDTRFHTIDAQGYKAGCTALTSEEDNKRAKGRLAFPEGFSRARELRTFNCNSCDFRTICSSGCLALSFDDGSGECSGASGLFETIRSLQLSRTS